MDQVSHVEPVSFKALNLTEAAADIRAGLSEFQIWTALSWQEFSSTYHRSLIGVAWVTFTFAAFVFVKLTVFSTLLETGDARYYDAYLVVGFFAWMYISQAVNGAPDTFTSAQGWIRSEPLPLSLYVFKSVTREIYNLVLTFIVVVIALVYLRFGVDHTVWYCVPAIVFWFLNAFSIKLLLGVVSARVRDISHLVKAIMTPMLFLTPIFWMPSQMPGLMRYLWWNPFYHYIELFRSPIVDGAFPTQSWLYAIALFTLVTLTAFFCFARFRQRIVFWF